MILRVFALALIAVVFGCEKPPSTYHVNLRVTDERNPAATSAAPPAATPVEASPPASSAAAPATPPPVEKAEEKKAEPPPPPVETPKPVPANSETDSLPTDSGFRIPSKKKEADGKNGEFLTDLCLIDEKGEYKAHCYRVIPESINEMNGSTQFFMTGHGWTSTVHRVLRTTPYSPGSPGYVNIRYETEDGEDFTHTKVSRRMVFQGHGLTFWFENGYDEPPRPIPGKASIMPWKEKSETPTPTNKESSP